MTVARQRPQREELAITVVTQIKHARETRRRKARLVPQTMLTLFALQVLDAARHSLVIDLTRRHQTHQRPCRLRRRARRALVAAIVELVALAALAPTAVFVLNRQKPLRGAPDARIVVRQAGRVQRTQRSPRPVDVVQA